MPSGLRYGVELRAAQAADVAEVVRLLAQAGLTLTEREAAARLDAVRAGAASAVLVATGNTGLTGLVAVSWAVELVAGPVARVSVLLVDADERRHGIGRMLLKAASQAARSAGCDVLEVTLAPGQDAAEAFCRATGFAAAGVTMRRALRRRGGG